MRIYMTLCITTRMQRHTHVYVYKVQLKLNVYKRRVNTWMVAIDIYVPLVRACQNLLMEKTWVKVAAADSRRGAGADSWRGSGADSQLPASQQGEKRRVDEQKKG